MLCPQLASAKYIDTWIKFFINSFDSFRKQGIVFWFFALLYEAGEIK